MARERSAHLDEETVQKYSTGDLSGRRLAKVEEHLLICESCRQSVAASDAHVAGMRQAAREWRQLEQNPERKAPGKAAGKSTR